MYEEVGWGLSMGLSLINHKPYLCLLPAPLVPGTSVIWGRCSWSCRRDTQLPGTWFCTVWVPPAGPAAPGPGHGVTVRVLTGAVQPEQHARAPLTPYDISPPPGRFKPSSFISAGPANSQIARLCRYVLTH